MKQFKNYFIVGLICLLFGGIVGWFSHKQPIKYFAGETCYEMRDTCASNKVIANVTTETNTIETGGVKKGKSTTTTSTFPIEQVAKQDTDVVTTFTKSYNTGLMRMKVTATVTAKSSAKGKIAMEYELDTLVLKSMTTVNNVVVVSKDTTDKVPDSIIRYIPLETEKSTGTYLGLVGGLDYNKSLDYTAGLQLAGERAGLVLYTHPKNWKYVGLQLNTKLIKIKK